MTYRYLPIATALLFCTPLLLSLRGQAAPLGLVLPTANEAIFSTDQSRFYMYTDRNFEGRLSKPWQGGTYGFSRNQRRTSIGIVYTRFHEGIDIRPLRRDSQGRPLDKIRSIADGTVVYINADSTASNYGRYLVVHHDWGHGPFYSLYAHLYAAETTVGKRVKAGEIIAEMGYTGRGINRERAHVHVELNFLMSDRFARWHNQHFTSPNHHGNYNGLNMYGIDIANLLKIHRANPMISIPEFLINHEEVHYRVTVPRTSIPPFLQRYPWLGRDMDRAKSAQSWEFGFAATGVPLEIRPSARAARAPYVSYIKPSATDHSYLTNGRITGTGSNGTLTAGGSRAIQLISDTF
ncbi:MAG: M23 family metallopeptidase [Verrucomicrobiota bacterium]